MSADIGYDFFFCMWCIQGTVYKCISECDFQEDKIGGDFQEDKIGFGLLDWTYSQDMVII